MVQFPALSNISVPCLVRFCKIKKANTILSLRSHLINCVASPGRMQYFHVWPLFGKSPFLFSVWEVSFGIFCSIRCISIGHRFDIFGLRNFKSKWNQSEINILTYFLWLSQSHILSSLQALSLWLLRKCHHSKNGKAVESKRLISRMWVEKWFSHRIHLFGADQNRLANKVIRWAEHSHEQALQAIHDCH